MERSLSLLMAWYRLNGIDGQGLTKNITYKRRLTNILQSWNVTASKELLPKSQMFYQLLLIFLFISESHTLYN